MQISAAPSSTQGASSLDVSTEHPTAASIPMFGIRGDYQHPDSTQTLREGLAEYYRVNPGLVVPSTLTNAKSASFFHCHDCTHVVFGTHTGALDESVNDMLTMFGVDLRFREYLTGFAATSEAKSIFKAYASVSLLARMTWWTLKLLPKLWRTGRQMTQKWPWNPSDELLDRPLCVLRAQYNIEVFRPEQELGLTNA